ncbi:putative acyl-CoA hydrolase [Helianthus annuus]|nr:putative acyl-CoA hydrolase [Helianthus annuus]
MDFEWVKNYLEKIRTSSASSNDIDSTPSKLFEAIIMWGLKLDRIDHGRVICSMKLPPRLLNVDSSLHGGAMAALVDVIGGVAIRTVTNTTTTGVSMEINVSYLDAAYVGDEIEIEANVLRVGKVVAVATVEFRNKKNGKTIAQGRHTKYLAVSSKL